MTLPLIILQVYPAQPQPYYPGQSPSVPQPSSTTVIHQGGFDAGARFDRSGPSLPVGKYFNS